MITWTRPTGTTITTNDRKETIEHAEAQGWTREVAEKPKRKRRTKAEIEADKLAEG